MTQDESSVAQQNARLALFHRNQQLQPAVREHQRLARDAVSQAVLDSPARFEKKKKKHMELGVETRMGAARTARSGWHTETAAAFRTTVLLNAKC